MSPGFPVMWCPQYGEREAAIDVMIFTSTFWH